MDMNSNDNKTEGDCPIKGFFGLDSKEMISREEAAKLVADAKMKLSSASAVLDLARSFISDWGLTVDSSILDTTYQSSFLPARFYHCLDSKTNAMEDTTVLTGLPNNVFVLSTTGGHSNTNHVIQSTGNPFADKLAEYKRSYKRRAKAMKPEERGVDRWDQPRVQGSRRRRITRDSDLPCAPPEPPSSGYVVFVGQMTVKVRHDRPHVRHNQTNVIGEISNMWKYVMSESERAYYNNFSKEAREEYKQQYREYKATGGYTKSLRFEKLRNVGPWVHILDHEKNALEKELASYPTVIFPSRPPNSEEPDPSKEKKKKKKNDVTEKDGSSPESKPNKKKTKKKRANDSSIIAL